MTGFGTPDGPAPIRIGSVNFFSTAIDNVIIGISCLTENGCAWAVDTDSLLFSVLLVWFVPGVVVAVGLMMLAADEAFSNWKFWVCAAGLILVWSLFLGGYAMPAFAAEEDSLWWVFGTAMLSLSLIIGLAAMIGTLWLLCAAFRTPEIFVPSSRSGRFWLYAGLAAVIAVWTWVYDALPFLRQGPRAVDWDWFQAAMQAWPLACPANAWWWFAQSVTETPTQIVLGVIAVLGLIVPLHTAHRAAGALATRRSNVTAAVVGAATGTVSTVIVSSIVAVLGAILVVAIAVFTLMFFMVYFMVYFIIAAVVGSAISALVSR